MNLNDYQQLAHKTSAFKVTHNTHHNHVAMAVFGLAGETGEVADLLKKHYFHSHPLDKQALIKELGDVAWYLAELCTAMHISLEEVCELNIRKLQERYGERFSSERSINRRLRHGS